MKWLSYLIASFIVLSGGVFALQGLRLLPSRLMYGRPEWIIIGGAMVVIGFVLLAWLALRGKRTANS